MKISVCYSSIAAISILATSGVLAAERGHDGCGGDKTIHVFKMGSVDEADLHSHIIRTQDRLRNMRGHSPRGAWNRTESRAHLIDMRVSLKQMHNEMYESGCKGALHGASLESRVKALEQR